MIVKHFVVGLYQCNCYILSCEKTKETIIIDPGDQYLDLVKYIQDNHLILKYILLTHAHLDHIMAVNRLKEATNAKVVLHEEDVYLSQNIELQASILQIDCDDKRELKIDEFAKEAVEFVFGEQTLNCLHTPGHSPGSCCYQLKEYDTVNNLTDNNPIIYSGDTLFAQSIGRTDLWKGNYEQIIDSIQTKLFSEKKETLVYPGHGDMTTIEKERHSNPFFNS